jgi:hypothetical protein
LRLPDLRVEEIERTSARKGSILLGHPPHRAISVTQYLGRPCNDLRDSKKPVGLQLREGLALGEFAPPRSLGDREQPDKRFLGDTRLLRKCDERKHIRSGSVSGRSLRAEQRPDLGIGIKRRG